MPVGGSNGVEMKTICFEKVKEPFLLALEREMLKLLGNVAIEDTMETSTKILEDDGSLFQGLAVFKDSSRKQQLSLF